MIDQQRRIILAKASQDLLDLRVEVYEGLSRTQINLQLEKIVGLVENVIGTYPVDVNTTYTSREEYKKKESLTLDLDL